MPWWYSVAERDHTIQNPTSEDKIRLLGERLRLGPTKSVLDVACGKAGPAIVLARAFGCRIIGVERAPEFVAAARERVDAAGLADRIEIVQQDAAEFPIDPERYETLHWQAVEAWLARHPDDPDAPEFRRRNAGYRDDYLRRQRELLGWAIFIARKR